MPSLIHVILPLLFGVLSMVHGRFILYDSDDSKTKVDIEAEFADVKIVLANIFSKLNALDAQTDGTEKPFSNTTLHQPEEMMCLDGWFRFKESCYFFDTKNIDFKKAEKECNTWEAHIVSLETQEENHFLKVFMANHFKKDAHFWIGMTDTETEGVWKISGTDTIVPFTDWKGTEPQNGGGNEDCALFLPSYSYGWADVTCGGKSRALCEKSSKSL